MNGSNSELEGQSRPKFGVDSLLIVEMEEGSPAEDGNSPATESTPKPVNQEEPSSFSDLSHLSKKDRLVELTKMSYHDFQMGIFTDSLETHPRRLFFFEPVVFLDPRKIVTESHGLFKEDVVRFTIQMWTPDIRLKVLDRLRSLPALAKQVIQLDDVQVIPFDDVQLAHNPELCTQKLIHLVNPPISYRRMNESLDFYLLCDSLSSANQLADYFRRNPEFALKKWQLRLVCRGLALGNNPAASVKFSFNVTPAPQGSLDVVPPRPTYFGAQMNSSNSLSSWANVVPVFSVRRCPKKMNISYGSYVTYTDWNFATKIVHGFFQLPSGNFTVKTPGIYQFHFNGQVLIGESSLFTRAELVVNDTVKAVSRSTTKSDSVRIQPISLSALLPLKAGDRAGVRLVGGTIYVDDTYVTRFEGILFADK